MYACRGFESIHQGHFPTTILKIDFFQNYQICQIIFGFHFFVHLSSWWSVCPRINWLNSTKYVWNGDWQIGDPRGPKGIFVYFFLFVSLIFDSIQTKMFGMVICHALFFSLNHSSKPLWEINQNFQCAIVKQLLRYKPYDCVYLIEVDIKSGFWIKIVSIWASYDWFNCFIVIGVWNSRKENMCCRTDQMAMWNKLRYYWGLLSILAQASSNPRWIFWIATRRLHSRWAN